MADTEQYYYYLAASSRSACGSRLLSLRTISGIVTSTGILSPLTCVALPPPTTRLQRLLFFFLPIFVATVRSVVSTFNHWRAWVVLHTTHMPIQMLPIRHIQVLLVTVQVLILH